MCSEYCRETQETGNGLSGEECKVEDRSGREILTGYHFAPFYFWSICVDYQFKEMDKVSPFRHEQVMEKETSFPRAPQLPRTVLLPVSPLSHLLGNFTDAGVTGSGVQCYNYCFQYLFFSNRMCRLGPKPCAKVIAKLLFAVVRLSSRYLGNGHWIAPAGVQELRGGPQEPLWWEGGSTGAPFRKRTIGGFRQLRWG